MKWTTEADEHLRSWIEGGMMQKVAARRLGTSPRAIKLRCYQLKIRRPAASANDYRMQIRVSAEMKMRIELLALGKGVAPARLVRELLEPLL